MNFGGPQGLSRVNTAMNGGVDSGMGRDWDGRGQMLTATPTSVTVNHDAAGSGSPITHIEILEVRFSGPSRADYCCTDPVP